MTTGRCKADQSLFFLSSLLLVTAFAPTASGQTEDWWKNFEEAARRMRRARCATAICWGENFEFGLEPLVEVPIGKTFSSSGLGGLANFENSHDLSATFTAGLRFWFFHDWVSVSTYLSKPLFSSSSGTIRVNGSNFEYGVQNVRRPYPGLAIGLFTDAVWIGIDIDELRNGDTDTSRDPNFPRNAVVSRAVVFTVALLPVTIARNAIGNVTFRRGETK